MTWYAILTTPSAQMPQREFVTETVERSKKGYRLVPSLNPNISAVERSLSRNGFQYYMPVERRLIRDRKKAGLWKPRRFPLLQGYVFILDATDFPRLEDTPGVSQIIKIQGRPIVVPDGAIATLRQIEAECDERLQRLKERLEEQAKRVTRRRGAAMFPKGSPVRVTSKALDGPMYGTVDRAARDGRIKVILDSMMHPHPVSFPLDALELVA